MTEQEYVTARNISLLRSTKALLRDVLIVENNPAQHALAIAGGLLEEALGYCYEELGEFDGGVGKARGSAKDDAQSSAV